MSRFLSVLPLSLLLAALPAQTESASQSPFRLVPADANFVVRMAAPAKWKQSFGTTQIAKLFQSQTLSPMVGMLEQNYQKALEEMRKEGGFDADLIDAMLTDYTGEMVLALRIDLDGIEEMMQSGEPPNLKVWSHSRRAATTTSPSCAPRWCRQSRRRRPPVPSCATSRSAP